MDKELESSNESEGTQGINRRIQRLINRFLRRKDDRNDQNFTPASPYDSLGYDIEVLRDTEIRSLQLNPVPTTSSESMRARANQIFRVESHKKSRRESLDEIIHDFSTVYREGLYNFIPSLLNGEVQNSVVSTKRSITGQKTYTGRWNEQTSQQNNAYLAITFGDLNPAIGSHRIHAFNILIAPEPVQDITKINPDLLDKSLRAHFEFEKAGIQKVVLNWAYGTNITSRLSAFKNGKYQLGILPQMIFYAERYFNEISDASTNRKFLKPSDFELKLTFDPSGSCKLSLSGISRPETVTGGNGDTYTFPKVENTIIFAFSQTGQFSLLGQTQTPRLTPPSGLPKFPVTEFSLNHFNSLLEDIKQVVPPPKISP